MTEMTGTIYKCQHCDFLGTYKNSVKIHEEKCLENQTKKQKNLDKQEIYDLLEIDVINIKIKDFLQKYNMPINDCTNYCCIEILNNFRPAFMINNKLTGGIFDRSKFKIHSILINEYHDMSSLINESSIYIDTQISSLINEIDELINQKKTLILESTKKFIKSKNDK